MKPSLWQILIIVLIIILIFGAKRLPDVASSIGKSLKIFKKEVTELREDEDPAPGGPTAGPPASHGTTPPPRAGEDPGSSTTPPGGSGSDYR